MLHRASNTSRLWLAVVVAGFCLPLFVGLGDADLENDEALYSYAVDTILATGDWMTPRTSPNQHVPFLEKPPLKIWIVAAPIRLGLLPDNEFGLRFWDALFGGVVFLYIFAIGNRLAGPMCGISAVLLFFVHWPVVFEHGLRSNTMEAPLLLCYCGGIFHFLAWASSRSRRAHAAAVALYFVLGFMTKFVAALFLPLVLGVATLVVGSYRKQFVRDWRLWTGVTVLVLALCMPWFAYAHGKFGAYFWNTILAEHVYRRFTASLDPSHLQPWHFYFSDMYRRLDDPDSGLLVVAGMGLLLVQTIRLRWAEGLVLLLWFVLPVAAISAGTSKLYHYVYPFLPPLALAGGYLLALAVSIIEPRVDSALEAVDRYATAHVPRLVAAVGRPAVRVLALAAGAAAISLAVVTLVYGQVRIPPGRTAVFKNSSVLRPCLVAVACGLLARAREAAVRLAVPVLIASLLPLPAYRGRLERLQEGAHPMRTARDCVQRVDSQVRGSAAVGVYVDVPDEAFTHPIYYYFGNMRAWARMQVPSAEMFHRYLHDPTEPRPMLVSDTRYQALQRSRDNRGRPVSPEMVRFRDVLLLLPGPYAACGAGPRGRHDVR